MASPTDGATLVLEPLVPAKINLTESASRTASDRYMPYLLGAAAIFSGLVVTLLIFFVVQKAWPVFRAEGLSFITSGGWDQQLEDSWGGAAFFGVRELIVGSVLSTAGALIVSLVLGLGCAIFLAELAPPRLSSSAAMLIELLAAVPSVIYGLVGVSILVPLMRTAVQPALKAMTGSFWLFSGPAYGVGFLTAGIVLAIMVVPFIVSVGREVLLAVPREQREAALALGSTRWESTWHVVLPYARPGLYGAIFLALGRALGETMAVTMVIGNRTEIAASLLAPGYSMAAVIANEFTEASDELYLQALVEVGLVLFVLTMVVNGLARLLIMATTQKGSAV
jgi:phosphate transport system permease protein